MVVQDAVAVAVDRHSCDRIPGSKDDCNSTFTYSPVLSIL